MIHKSFYFASQKSFFKKQISSENKGSYFLKETILTTLAHHNPCLGKKSTYTVFFLTNICEIMDGGTLPIPSFQNNIFGF